MRITAPTVSPVDAKARWTVLGETLWAAATSATLIGPPER